LRLTTWLAMLSHDAGFEPGAPTTVNSQTSLSTGAGDEPHLHIEGPVATLTLRRPAVANRLSFGDLAVFQDLLARVDSQEAVRVLLLRGQGRHFCSGFDLGEVGARGAEGATRFEALADALERSRPLTVVQLQGGAYGGAVDLALAADFRVGGPRTEMRIPAARLGLHFYRGGLERLTRRFGLPLARRLLVAADTLEAAALEHALVLDRVAKDAADVPACAEAFARELALLAPLAVLGMKKHLNRIARGQLDAAELQRDMDRAAESADLLEGARAWHEGRPPRFEGR
jgi:enoyl-CoA hydratase/carnithine racemase